MSGLSPRYYEAPGVASLKRVAPWILLVVVVVVILGMLGTYRGAAKEYAATHSKSLATTGTAEAAKGKAASPAKESAPAKKPAAAKTQTYEVVLGGLNFRSDPSLRSKVIRALSKGERLTLVQSSGKWYKVKDAKGAEGWVTSSPKFVKPTTGQ